MYKLVTLEPVDYLVIGHVSEDLTQFGTRLGGTAAYSSLTAKALGLRVGVITASGPETSLEILKDIAIIPASSEYSTTFDNIDTEDGRRQVLHRRALPLSYEQVPAVWRRTDIVHLGPIAQEIEMLLPDSFFPSLLGLTPQGWMRTWDESGKVTKTVWNNAEQALKQAGAVVLSIEDVAGDEEQIEFMANHTRVLVVTEGAAGSRLYWNGDQRRFHAPKVLEVDATGAGDIFAAAFFIRLQITRDPWEAARFATQLAAHSVTRTGLESVPTAEEIQACLVEVS